jgi:sugar-specific transcriptional regulator TrmB
MLPFLNTIGLTDKEADLYELLIQKGEMDAGDIIKASKLKRATAYKVLYSLEAKGLLTHKDLEKKLHFRPEPPAKLFELAETRYRELERAKNDLHSSLPQLTSNYILSVERPIVKTFEGVEGLKEIYEDTIREAKPIYAVHQLEELDPKLFQWLRKSYIPQRIKFHIHAYVIVASGSEAKTYVKRSKISNRTTITVPRNQFPFQHEVNIYGDKVAFINGRNNTKLIGMIIQHPLTAKTMKSWFDLAWKGAELFDKSVKINGFP